MTRLPSLSTQDTIRALQRGGFQIVRHSDHVCLKRDGKTVSVPHKQHEMRLSTLRRLLRYADISTEEFNTWRQQ